MIKYTPRPAKLHIFSLEYVSSWYHCFYKKISIFSFKMQSTYTLKRINYKMVPNISLEATTNLIANV